MRVGSGVQTDATAPNIVAPTMLGVVAVRVGSGVQTDATNPNIVAPTMLGVVAVRVGSGVQTDATAPNNVGTCSASWEGYNPYVFVIHA